MRLQFIFPCNLKGDAATVNTWVSSTKANDKELVFAGEGLFAITETLDPAKLQFSYDDFEFVENLYSSVFVLSADSSLNLKNLDDLEAYVKAGNPVSVAVNGVNTSTIFLPLLKRRKRIIMHLRVHRPTPECFRHCSSFLRYRKSWKNSTQ